MWEPQVANQAAVTLSAASAGRQRPAACVGQMRAGCLQAAWPQTPQTWAEQQPRPDQLHHPTTPHQLHPGLVFMAVEAS